MKKSKKWFTLVELIVVITILAILWTIAFLSLQWYSTSARNSTRTSDLNSIKSAFEMYSLKVWWYPNPTNWVAITYSWSTAWNQWTVWDSVIGNLSSLSKKPIDPLLWNEYTYSLLNTKWEYQLWAIEENSYWYNQSINTSFAAQNWALAMIVWNYNGQILKVNTGWLDYILAVPSIINTDISDKDLVSVINKRQLAYNHFSNLPDSYKWKWYTMTGWFNFWWAINIIVFTWSTSSLASSWTLQIAFVDSLKNAYSGSQLASDWNLQQLLNSSSSSDKQSLVVGMFSNKISGLNGTVTVSNSTTTSGYTWSCPSWQWWNWSSCVVAPNCTTGLTEITLSNWQVWSCLNLWATTVRDGSTNTFSTCTSNLDCSNKPSWFWDYYQWWRNEPVNTTTTVATYNGAFTWLLWHNNFVLWGWTYWDWWLNEDWSTTPTRWTWTNPQWPCPSWRHVPSQNDWQIVCNTISWTNCANNSITVTAMQTTLRLPFAGNRAWNNGYYNGQSSGAYYWSSTPNSNNSSRMDFNASYFNPVNVGTRSSGFSIRCFKN